MTNYAGFGRKMAFFDVAGGVLGGGVRCCGDSAEAWCWLGSGARQA